MLFLLFTASVQSRKPGPTPVPGVIITQNKRSSYKNKIDQQQNQLKIKAVTLKQFNLVITRNGFDIIVN